jgi:16S rRNA (uracil1498-N3)-methyltransferase
LRILLMRRFFFDPVDRKGETVLLPPDESRHATKVIRLGEGSEIELLDGSGAVYAGYITATGKRVAVQLTKTERPGESGTSLTVLQGVLKGEKMDMVVQKFTELGVETIRPFHSARCQGKLNASAALKKHGRWERIALAACKQSLRVKLMGIETPVTMDQALAQQEKTGRSSVKLLFWEEEDVVSLDAVKEIETAGSITIAIGPEGGFTQEEIDGARALGWQTVSLGKLILRAETAALTAVALTQFLCGNLKT